MTRGRPDRRRRRRPVRHDSYGGGADGDGTVFEIAKTATGYASTPTTLVSFNGTDGAMPDGRPDRRRQRRPVRHDLRRRRERRRHGVRDRQDRHRLRQHAHHAGQLQRHRWRHPDGRPDRRRRRRPVRHDRSGGANDDGTVFEIAKTATGYASTPTTLVSFNGANGANPHGGLIADANGDLFGTTDERRRGRRRHGVRDRQDRHRLRQHADHAGQLQRHRRREPRGEPDRRRRRRPVRHDAEGGAAATARCSRSPRPPTGYASTPTTLASFNGTDGANPLGGPDRRRRRRPVRHDCPGRRERTTARCSRSPAADSRRIQASPAKTWALSTPVGRSREPEISMALAQTASCGATRTGMSSCGTRTARGASPTKTWALSTPLADRGNRRFQWQLAKTASFGATRRTGMSNSGTLNGSGGFTYENLGVVNTCWQIAGTGDFNGSGEDGILWRNTSTGMSSFGTRMARGASPTKTWASHTCWQIQGTGDFNGSGEDGILWRNT